MTALAANTVIKERNLGRKLFPVEDNVHIYQGSLVCVNGNGNAVPAADTSGYVCVGVAYEEIDNTLVGHTAGGKNIRVLGERNFDLKASGLTQASVGLLAYVSDSATIVTSGTANAIIVGMITEYVSATECYVIIHTDNPPYPGLGTQSVAAITASAATLPVTGAAGSGAGAGGTVTLAGGVGGATGAGGATSITGGTTTPRT